VDSLLIIKPPTEHLLLSSCCTLTHLSCTRPKTRVSSFKSRLPCHCGRSEDTTYRVPCLLWLASTYHNLFNINNMCTSVHLVRFILASLPAGYVIRPGRGSTALTHGSTLSTNQQEGHTVTLRRLFIVRISVPRSSLQTQFLLCNPQPLFPKPGQSNLSPIYAHYLVR